MEQLIGRLLEENCPYLPSGGTVDQHLKWIKGQLSSSTHIGILALHLIYRKSCGSAVSGWGGSS
jgi:hypothetical protein